MGSAELFPTPVISKDVLSDKNLYIVFSITVNE